MSFNIKKSKKVARITRKQQQMCVAFEVIDRFEFP